MQNKLASVYHLAQILQSQGFWKANLPAKCFDRLSEYLGSPETWEFFLSGAKGIEQENTHSEDFLICLRVRLLLYDAYFHSQDGKQVMKAIVSFSFYY